MYISTLRQHKRKTAKQWGPEGGEATATVILVQLCMFRYVSTVMVSLSTQLYYAQHTDHCYSKPKLYRQISIA